MAAIVKDKKRFGVEVVYLKNKVDEINQKIKHLEIKQDENENLNKIRIASHNVDLVSIYCAMTDLSLSLLGYKNESYLDKGRKSLYKSIISLEAVVSNYIDMPLGENYELLKSLVQTYIDSTHTGIDQIDLMTKLYSIRWIMHPRGREVEKKLELYLDSLVETGELSKINSEYVVNGKAIVTIENYEEAERRHIDNIKAQKRMIYLILDNLNTVDTI